MGSERGRAFQGRVKHTVCRGAGKPALRGVKRSRDPGLQDHLELDACGGMSGPFGSSAGWRRGGNQDKETTSNVTGRRSQLSPGYQPESPDTTVAEGYHERKERGGKDRNRRATVMPG